MALLNLSCFATSLVPKFDTPKWRPVRGGMFIAAGVSSVGFIIHIYLFKGSSVVPPGVNVGYYVAGGYSYI